MDRIACEGIRFDRAYPTNTICMPARASLITGRSQRGHQVFDHGVNLSEAIPVMGDSLRTAGYATALIGKAHFKTAEFEDVLPDHPPVGASVSSVDGLWHGPYYGFEHVDIHTGHAYPAGHWRIWLEREHPEGLSLWTPERAITPLTGAYASWKNALPSEWHYTAWTADRTIAWLRQRDQDQPFFLWMSFADPHQPFAPPRPYCDMYDAADMPDAVPAEDVSSKPPHYQRARDGLPYGGYDTHSGWSGDHRDEIISHYYGLTTFIDDSIGLVLAELEHQGLLDSVHIVFTSDHGEALGDHGIAGKPAMSYECVNRVPLLWRHPPTIARGRVHTGVASHIDLVPTFLDLAGATPLNGAEGRSMTPLLRGDSDTHRDAAIVERISVLRSGRAVSGPAGPTVVRVKMLVTERWKLLHYGSKPYGELYDVQNDPEDLNNLWADPAHANVRRELMERLLAEIVDDELGDAAAILADQGSNPYGTLRDPRLLETTPPYAASDLVGSNPPASHRDTPASSR